MMDLLMGPSTLRGVFEIRECELFVGTQIRVLPIALMKPSPLVEASTLHGWTETTFPIQIDCRLS